MNRTNRFENHRFTVKAGVPTAILCNSRWSAIHDLIASQAGMGKRTAKKIRAGGSSAVNARRTMLLGYAATRGRSDLLIMLGLAVVTLAIYAQVVGHQFITLDDPTYIQENPMVNRGVTPAGLAWAFTTFHATNWHPLSWISHMIDCQLFGTNAGR